VTVSTAICCQLLHLFLRYKTLKSRRYNSNGRSPETFFPTLDTKSGKEQRHEVVG
jgi:hypothetical protein